MNITMQYTALSTLAISNIDNTDKVMDSDLITTNIDYIDTHLVKGKAVDQSWNDFITLINS
jgi:hypothetical protein